MNSRRIALAFLIAPLIIPIAALVAYSFPFTEIPSFRAVLGGLIQYGGLAYLVAVVFGIPTFLCLRASRWRGKWAASLC